MGKFVFRLPDVGEGTAEAEIVAWHVALGDVVEEDQPLVDVMTDKATVEITSPVAGRVVARRGEPGEMFAVGGPILEFETEGGAKVAEPVMGAPNPSGQRNAEARETPATTPETDRSGAFPAASALPAQTGDGAAASANAPAFFESEPSRPLTSPAIRRRAREAGVDLAHVKGGGPDGRVTREDFDAYVSKQAAGGRPGSGGEEITEVKVIGLRRKIAEKMSEAKRRIPHFAYVEECDVTELEALRAHLNATRKPGRPKLTFLPFMIFGLARALPDFPQINARYDDDAGVVRRYRALHLGMAAQTPGGLVVPVIRDAQTRSLWDLAEEIARLAAAVRDGSARKEELSGSTLTLTSLGPLGGVAHTPVINHPEVAIVGPNRIVERPVVRESQIVVRKMMNISSSFDHRVVDGHDAAAFIQAVKGRLEYPATLFTD